MVSTFVYCVRHGQTAENLQGIVQGQQDTQLDEVGVKQAAAVAEALKDICFDVAFTSDLTRAVDTANAILNHHPGIPFNKLSILRERYMGSLQGQKILQSGRRVPLDETVETSTAFMERILQFWDHMVIPHAKNVAETHADSGRPSCILVVSHGAYLSTMARGVMGHRDIVKAPEITLSWCPNTSITLIEVQTDGTGSLQKFGDISHLAEPVVLGNADELKVVNDLYASKNK